MSEAGVNDTTYKFNTNAASEKRVKFHPVAELTTANAQKIEVEHSLFSMRTSSWNHGVTENLCLAHHHGSPRSSSSSSCSQGLVGTGRPSHRTAIFRDD